MKRAEIPVGVGVVALAKGEVSVGVDEYAEVGCSEERETKATSESDLAAVVVRQGDCGTEAAANGFLPLREQVAPAWAHGTEPQGERGQIKRILSRNDGAIVFDHRNLAQVLRRAGCRAQCLSLGSKLAHRAEIARTLQFALQAIRSCAAERMRRFHGTLVKG